LAIVVTNATSSPSPAGLLGKLVVTFDDGEPMSEPVSGKWRVSREPKPDWTAAEFDDRAWVTAKEVVPFGAQPWGILGVTLTLSPAKADPFVGHCEIPSSVDLARSRIILEMESIAPEEAARVTINGAYAGGFIGRPLRLDVTKHVKQGRNTIRIEPFAPSGARLVCYER
jgi:hypothetical protein